MGMSTPPEARISLIKKLERLRGSHVIVYVTGDRPNLLTVIADDAVRVFYEHLRLIGGSSKVDLFLYSRGGHSMAPFRLVGLIREYAKRFEVLVPYRAHSAGTMICLGADAIVMGKMAELSPVDPSTANAFNPQDPANPMRRLPISVEDVTAYLNLAKDEAGLTSEDKVLEVFRALTQQVHSVALGNINRVYNVTRLLIPRLLGLHMDGTGDAKIIDSIVKALAETYTHDYLITRSEAEKLGLKAVRPDDQLEAVIWELYEAYEEDLRLREPFNPETLLGTSPACNFRFETAYVETVGRTDAFIQEGTITRMAAPAPSGVPSPPAPAAGVTVRFTKQIWEKIR